MERANLNRYYTDNVGLIHQVAGKGYRRLQGMGASVEYDDLFQDLTEIFIKSFDAFDEALGYKFSTYFTFSAYNRINKIAEKVQIERIDNGTRSIEELSSASDEAVGFEERIASDAPTPDQHLEAQHGLRELVTDLSPLAREILSLAVDPPEFMEREFHAAQAHAEYARSIGKERRARQSLGVQFVCTVLAKTSGIAPGLITAARAEINAAARRKLHE